MKFTTLLIALTTTTVFAVPVPKTTAYGDLNNVIGNPAYYSTAAWYSAAARGALGPNVDLGVAGVKPAPATGKGALSSLFNIGKRSRGFAWYDRK